MLEKTEQKIEELSILKPGIKKKDKILSAKDYALLFMLSAIEVIFLILIWVFQVSIPPGWMFMP